MNCSSHHDSGELIIDKSQNDKCLTNMHDNISDESDNWWVVIEDFPSESFFERIL